jgi:hypothetical protein
MQLIWEIRFFSAMKAWQSEVEAVWYSALQIKYTGSFIMVSVIINIYKKKNQRNYLNGIESNGIDNFLAAFPIDILGLCRKMAGTRSTSSSAVKGRPLDFCLHRHPAAEM